MSVISGCLLLFMENLTLAKYHRTFSENFEINDFYKPKNISPYFEYVPVFLYF